MDNHGSITAKFEYGYCFVCKKTVTHAFIDNLWECVYCGRRRLTLFEEHGKEVIYDDNHSKQASVDV